MRRDLARLAEGPFDLLIIGGGIVGVGIAWDAALRGLSCALVEQGDFASGTSSKTTKLIHGGIRYLEQLEFKLVRSAVRERKMLLQSAPPLVKPLPFLIPVLGRSPRPWPFVRIGVALYDFLAGNSGLPRHQILPAHKLAQAEPLVGTVPARRAALYYDAQMDDVGLVFRVLKSAAEEGAQAANYCRVVGFLQGQGRISGAEIEDRLTGSRFPIRADAVVNATGPWVDRVRRLADPSARPIVRTSKGIHLVCPDIGLKHAILLSAPKDNRIFFLIPWNGLTLIGTTDTDYSGDPADAQAEPPDVDYLIRQANALLPALKLKAGRVICTFAGVRPLVADEKKDPWAVSRMHLIHDDANGLVSLVGGKYTTFRRIAEEAVDHVARRFQMKNLRPCRTARTPLVKTGEGEMHPPAAYRLAQRYGPDAESLLRWMQADRELAETLCPHHPFQKCEVRYAVEEEMALSLSDLLWRRLQVGLSPCRGLDAAGPAAEVMGRLLGWSAEEAQRQLRRYEEEVAASRRSLLVKDLK